MEVSPRKAMRVKRPPRRELGAGGRFSLVSDRESEVRRQEDVSGS